MPVRRRRRIQRQVGALDVDEAKNRRRIIERSYNNLLMCELVAESIAATTLTSEIPVRLLLNFNANNSDHCSFLDVGIPAVGGWKFLSGIEI